MAAAPPPTLIGADQYHGIAFAFDAQGHRSSTAAAKRVFGAASGACSPSAAEAIAADIDWRQSYPRHIARLVEASMANSRGALDAARSGLHALYQALEWLHDGRTLSLDLAMRAPLEEQLYTVTIVGTSREAPRLIVPYRGEALEGAQLRKQLERWVELGVAEPSFAAAIETVVLQPDWLDLSDWNIAVIGAGAALSAFVPLASWRANLAAVDAPAPGVWSRLIGIAREGNARVRIPVRAGSSADDPRLPDLAGASLLTAAPQIRNWLTSMAEPMAISYFARANGEHGVRMAAATDAIVADLLALRRNVVPAFFLSPMDCYAVPLQAAVQAQTRWNQRGSNRPWQSAVRWASGERLFAPNATQVIAAENGFRSALVDALALQQGPSHALANRIPQWRAMVARADGLRVSANVGPLIRPRSAAENRAERAAYDGARYLGVEVLEADTANALAAALLVHDLRTTDTSAAPEIHVGHPLQLFMDGAIHSGIWRTPFALRSVLPIAALLGYL